MTSSSEWALRAAPAHRNGRDCAQASGPQDAEPCNRSPSLYHRARSARRKETTIPSMPRAQVVLRLQHRGQRAASCSSRVRSHQDPSPRIPLASSSSPSRPLAFNKSSDARGARDPILDPSPMWPRIRAPSPQVGDSHSRPATLLRVIRDANSQPSGQGVWISSSSTGRCCTPPKHAAAEPPVRLLHPRSCQSCSS
ncbi:ATP synthase subunit delta, mitochondrial isoform X2 [Ovis canadensis]|uniref:ATP synthase subunit delta, mitochondrial isoform X2 n=1 Tax=Ovis canadensis TaxID=37174 RepID=UPI0037517349